VFVIGFGWKFIDRYRELNHEASARCFSRQSDVTGLINRFLASNEVQEEFALGVHDVYVSMHRSQFRKDATVSEILESPEQPAEWAEVCRVQGFSETLSPVFVVTLRNLRT